MRKFLLLAIFALVSTASTWAYEVGDYAYTTTQRMKILGENLVQNGNFAEGSTGWFNVDGTNSPSADSWSIESGAGPNGENVVMSISAAAGDDVVLSNRWKLDGGYYVFSFDILGSAYTNTTTTAGSTQYIDLFTNTDGSFAKGDGATTVATSAYYSDEWHKVNFVIFMEAGQYLVFNMARLSENTQLTNFELHAAASVFDVRIVEKRIELVTKLLNDPNFNTEEAQDVRAEILDIIGFMNEEIANGGLDDESTALAFMEEFEQKVSEYLDASSQNLTSNEFFNYVEDLTAFPKYNRGQISDGQQIGGFIFRGGNWLHASGGDVLAKQIQGTYTNGPGSVALYNTNLPAGKYYVSGSVRNAYCDKNYALTWNLENEVKIFVGSDSTDCGTIVGEDFVTFYTVGEIKEGQPLEAGFWWNDQANQGTRFEVKDFEIRAFGDVLSPYLHSKAWNAFIAQWNAAVSAREAVLAKIGDSNYPWEQDSLKAALAQWDPYFNEIIAKGWVAADGTDAGVATTEELDDWAIYQGVELYSEPDEEGNVTRLQYQVVRGYQNANNYVVEVNKPIADLAAEIVVAEKMRDDAQNAQGDKSSFQKAIDAAQAVLDDVLKNTSDDRRAADETRIADAISALQQAEVVFEESARIEPFVDIDFSNDFELITVVSEPAEGETEGTEAEYYTIKGAKGQMLFNTFDVQTDGNTTANYYAKGYNEELLDVLRVGKAEAWVEIDAANIPTDDEVLRVGFDVWVGNLTGRYFRLELRNAANERVGGFSINRYNGLLEYNDFNNEAGDGINWIDYVTGVGSSSASNSAICVDNNRTHIELVADFKAKGLQGKAVNPQRGTYEGAFMAMPALEDTKVVKFVVSSTYENADRRCWFDNLTMKKYPSIAEGVIDSGIRTVDTMKSAVRTQGIYNLQGVRMNGEQLPAGLYIINGKKVVIK